MSNVGRPSAAVGASQTPSDRLSDVELLAIETRVLWTIDRRGRLLSSTGREGAPSRSRAPLLFAGTARGARTIAFGSAVPDALADRLRAELDAEPLPVDPADEPDALAACERLLNVELGRVERSAGRSWVIESPPDFSSGAEIIRSTDGHGRAYISSVPEGFTWEHDEWQALMGGAFGPWAICTVDGTAVSLCHASRISEAGMEAGVWTHPDHRGRGYAAAATAAWASLVLHPGRHIFYSTNRGNRSSERVTERMGLRPIGWLWMLSPAISP